MMKKSKRPNIAADGANVTENPGTSITPTKTAPANSEEAAGAKCKEVTAEVNLKSATVGPDGGEKAGTSTARKKKANVNSVKGVAIKYQVDGILLSTPAAARPKDRGKPGRSNADKKKSKASKNSGEAAGGTKCEEITVKGILTRPKSVEEPKEEAKRGGGDPNTRPKSTDQPKEETKEVVAVAVQSRKKPKPKEEPDEQHPAEPEIVVEKATTPKKTGERRAKKKALATATNSTGLTKKTTENRPLNGTIPGKIAANAGNNEEKASASKGAERCVESVDHKQTVASGNKGTPTNKAISASKPPDPVKDTREPIKEDALPRLAADLIFPLIRKSPRFPKAVYFCRLCSCHINTLKYSEAHMKTEAHKKGKEEHYQLELLESIPWPPTDVHSAALNSFLLQTAEAVGRSVAEVQQCFQLADMLTGFFKTFLHPNCLVRLYGSSLTGFAVKTSNVNLELIYPPDMGHAFALTKAHELLLNEPQFFSCVECDFGAKWPSIRFFAKGCLQTGPVTCVLSVCNGEAHDISVLLSTYAGYFRFLAPLAQLTRYWVHLCQLSDAMLCGMPAYAFDLMLIHYLQQRRPAALPILHEMKELGLDLGNGIDGLYRAGSRVVQACINRCTDLMKPDEWNLAELWLGFLKYYSLDFDNVNLVINVRSSLPVTRQEKDWRSRRLAIEDPCIPNKNVAQMTQQMHTYTMHCFRMSYKYFAVPQTSRGPLFHFDQEYRLVCETESSTILLPLPSDHNTGPTAVNGNAAEVQKALLDLLQTMKQKETVNGAASTTKKSVGPSYGRLEMLDLWSNDYEWKTEWSVKCDCGQDISGPEHEKHGLEHAMFVREGNGPSMEQDSNVLHSSSGCAEASHAVTYVPSSSGRATPLSMMKNEQEDELACSTAKEKEKEDTFVYLTEQDKADEPVYSNGSEEEPCPQWSQGSEKEMCCTSFIGCVFPSRSAFSESSEYASADGDGDKIEKYPGWSAAECADGIVEENEEDGVDANNSLVEAAAAVTASSSDGMDPTIPCELNESPTIPSILSGIENSGGNDVASPHLGQQGEQAEGAYPTPIPVRRKERRQVSPELLEAIRQLNLTDYVFTFTAESCTEGKMPSVSCTFCTISGHHANVCPEKILPPLVVLPPLSPNYKKMLDLFLVDVTRSYAITTQRLQWQETFRASLECLLKEKLRPDSCLTLFGSSCNGFGFCGSDLDLCLTFGKSITLQGDESMPMIIKRVAKVLRKERYFRDVLPVTSAKVPIVRFFYTPNQLEGDISLYNCLALRNTELLRTYSRIDPRVRSLGYIVKVFAKYCEIGDASRGSLSSYAYVIMMLHYLQRTQPPVIPVLQEIHGKQGRPPLMVDGWNTYFYADLSTLPYVWQYHGTNKQSLHELWLGFLRYYTEVFEASTLVVQMRRSEPLSKFEKLWSDKPFAIEDPFDLSHNLASGLSWRMYVYIMKVFIQAREAFGHPRHENLMMTRLGHTLSYELLEKYFFDFALRRKDPPPKNGLCKYCGHVGHFVDKCPIKNPKRGDGNEKENAENGKKVPAAKAGK